VNYFNTVGWDCRFFFDGFDIIDSGPPLERARFIWRMLLKWRVVSVKDDEPICVGILMNFDMEKLMAVPLEERMREIWRMHRDQIPLSILFVPGERMQYPGFSWAPSSVLSCQSSGPDFQDAGTFTKHGLRLRRHAYTSFEFSSLTELKESIFPILLDGNRYFIKKSPVKSNPSWDGLDLHKKAELAIFIEIQTVQEGGTQVVRGGASRAALVEVIKGEDGVVFGLYLRMVSLIREGSSNHKFPNPMWTKGEIEEGNRMPCKAEWVAKEVEWCLV
jgi:uncharacterized protein (UPF0216 family)